jgi:glycine betaine catabolism B
MIEYEAEILDIIQRAPGVKSFRFNRKPGFQFKPGQWFFVHLQIDGEEKKKPFSFSSSPTEEGFVEFTKRLTSSGFSKKLDSLKKGDIVKLKMPYGNFTFEGENEKVALLSGGIGITPFRSILRYASDKRSSADMVLIYGSSDPDNIIFKEDLDSMEKSNPLFRIVHTVTCPDAQEKGWGGCCGYIDETMIKREIPDFAERVFFVCGPPGMVSCLVEILKKQLQVIEANIRIEHFVGYE